LKNVNNPLRTARLFLKANSIGLKKV